MITQRFISIFIFTLMLFSNFIYSQGYVTFGKHSGGYTYTHAKFDDLSVTSHMINLSPNGRVDLTFGLATNSLNSHNAFNAGVNVYAIKPESKLPIFPAISLAYSSNKQLRGFGFGTSLCGILGKGKKIKQYPEIGFVFSQIMAKDGVALYGDTKSKEMFFALNNTIKMGSNAHLIITPGISWNEGEQTFFISFGILFSEK